MRLVLLVLLAALLAAPTARAESCSTDACSPEGTDVLDLADFDRLLASWQGEELASPSLALETLLFHGERTRALLATVPAEALSEERRVFLVAELDRDSVTVEMRIIDARGALRGVATAEDIPLRTGRRLAFEGTGDLGFLITGGKVKRVGLDHLWSRW
jgi:hypothetical protein